MKKASVQVSFRLSKESRDALGDVASTMRLNQSEIVRRAVKLLSHAANLPDNVKLATVDVSDKSETGHYKVRNWIVVE